MEDKKTLAELIEANIDQPRGGKTIITLHNRPVDYDLVLEDDILDEIQEVIAVGPFVNDIKAGDKVRIALDKLSVRLQDSNGEYFEKLQVDPIQIGDTVCALISESIIKTIIKQ